MDTNEITFLEWAFKGLVGIVLSVGAWLWVNLVRATVKNKDDLAAHKLNVAENYATKDDLKESVGRIEKTVERVHERIDQILEVIKH